MAKTAKKPAQPASKTFREKAAQARKQDRKPRKIRQTASTLARPLKAAKTIGKKEYYLLLPKSKLGKFLNKRRHFFPAYFRNSWHELRSVTWPTRRETIRLTVAVFTFAIIFGLTITILDYGLDKLFRKVIL